MNLSNFCITHEILPLVYMKLLKKLRRAEGGAKNFRVFRVKKHDFTPKNHILPNCGGGREKFSGISCENHDTHLFFPCLTFNLKRNRVKENREKGVWERSSWRENKCRSKDTKKGGSFKKNHAPPHVSFKNLELVKSNSANGIIRTPDWLTCRVKEVFYDHDHCPFVNIYSRASYDGLRVFRLPPPLKLVAMI
jgi:hypothetical protein